MICACPGQSSTITVDATVTGTIYTAADIMPTIVRIVYLVWRILLKRAMQGVVRPSIESLDSTAALLQLHMSSDTSK